MIYPLRTGSWHVHPHNIAFDAVASSGLPVALLVVAVLHASDIPMYDSPLNIAGWILWAGVLCWIKRPQSS